MSNNKADYEQIIVTPNITIIHDIADGWLGIENPEWQDLMGHPGAVVVGVDELDALIVALGQVRKEMRENSGISSSR